MKSYKEKIAPLSNVELVMMSYDRSKEAALKWANKEQFPWPTVLGEDKDKIAFGKAEVLGVPTYILFDKQGNEVMRGKQEIFKKLEELKAAK